eukprot:3916858-Rhodomonas_salina.2
MASLRGRALTRRWDGVWGGVQAMGVGIEHSLITQRSLNVYSALGIAVPLIRDLVCPSSGLLAPAHCKHSTPDFAVVVVLLLFFSFCCCCVVLVVHPDAVWRSRY